MTRNCTHSNCQGETCRRPPKPKARRKRIKPYSKKRQKENRKYLKERKEFLKEGDECEAKLPGCTWLASELHHPSGRVGKKLTDVKRCKKVCRSCHSQIENAPLLAKQKGLSESRLNHPMKQQ